MTSQGSTKSKWRLLRAREFLANNFWTKWARAKLTAPSRSSRWYASEYVYHDLIRLVISWPQVMWPLRGLKVKTHIIQCALISWTQWDHARWCSSFLCEDIGKKLFGDLWWRDVTWPHGCHIAKYASRESRWSWLMSSMIEVAISGVSYRKSVYRYQTKYQPKPWQNTETEPT